MEIKESTFKPYISATDNVKEFTVKAIVMGSIFGIIFGASTAATPLTSMRNTSAYPPYAVRPNECNILWLEYLGVLHVNVQKW